VHYPLLFARPRELPAGDAACDERR